MPIILLLNIKEILSNKFELELIKYSLFHFK